MSSVDYTNSSLLASYTLIFLKTDLTFVFPDLFWNHLCNCAIVQTHNSFVVVLYIYIFLYFLYFYIF